MIELKLYNTHQSVDIQQIWNGDRFLLTKIALIAYKILIENVAIFLCNQTAKVRIFFKKPDAKIENPQVAPSLAPEKPPIPDYSLYFSRTVRASLTVALFWRTAKSLLGWATPLGEKVKNCGAVANGQWINNLKQFELKHCALASALIPLAIHLFDTIQKEPKELSLTQRIMSGGR